MRIARRERPVYAGVKFTFPHRYMLDKAVFGQRLLTEGGIMIDGSGSMDWTDDDMTMVISKMPAVWIGKYFSIKKEVYESGPNGVHRRSLLGRICVLAKHGKFAKHVTKESDATGMNNVDLEALQLLATWPKPRFWLSDGLVCGGIHDGMHPNPDYAQGSSWGGSHGNLVDLCNKVMRQHEILRVPDVETMVKLLRRQRVTLYASCATQNPATWARHPSDYIRDSGARWWLAPWKEQPVSYCL
jgi:phage gp37-like protein